MLRKLMVLVCLVSFVPAAASAQSIAAIAASPAAQESTIAAPTTPGAAVNLSLPAERSSTVLLAAAETPKDATMSSAPEQKPAARHSSFNWDNFTEVHLGDYRWVWWAGAAVALVAIHVGAH
ncbi:MAG: hypothetical protein PHP95_15460 [Desulfuromonadaceae bacterium]|nr:hypothetical protein [Desulfuromonadaceae bacterium]MDD2849848.1 hypothetical protein [Desulfuromonadaceae bacterium]MDD4131619.1 hypothetical protein [Desulfuromonadaceae bacterium]